MQQMQMLRNVVMTGTITPKHALPPSEFATKGIDDGP
jgi:hypothetical protein